MNLICFLNTFLWCTLIQKNVIVCQNIITSSLFQYLLTLVICIVLHLCPKQIHALYSCKSFRVYLFPVEIVPVNVGCLSWLLVFSIIGFQKSEVNLHSVKIIPLRADLALISSPQSSYRGNTPKSSLLYQCFFSLSTSFL